MTEQTPRVVRADIPVFPDRVFIALQHRFGSYGMIYTPWTYQCLSGDRTGAWIQIFWSDAPRSSGTKRGG